MYKVSDNREFPRMVIDCGITYNFVDEPHTRRAMIKNISGGGVLFIADEQPEIGAVMEIKVGPGNMSIPPLSAVVEVVRVNPEASGARFADDSQSVQFAAAAGPGYAASPGAGGQGAGFEVGARIMSVK